MGTTGEMEARETLGVVGGEFAAVDRATLAGLAEGEPLVFALWGFVAGGVAHRCRILRKMFGSGCFQASWNLSLEDFAPVRRAST